MAKKKRSRTAGGRSGNPALAGESVREEAPVEPPRPARGPALVPLEGYLPVPGASYPQVLRTSNYQPTQPFLGVIVGLGLYLAFTAVITRLVIMVGWWFGGRNQSPDAYSASALAFENPVGMLAANLGIAVLIPISWFLITVLHRVRPRWLSSVKPGIRWPFVAMCLGLAVVATVVTQILGSFFSPAVSLDPQPGLWGFVVVIVLSSPLQAMAEEVFFRGYLLQALGSLVASPWFGVIASSVLFALLHGTQNVPLFLNRLAFGLLAALLVLRTGGLEAGIAAHIVNNLAAYLLAGLTGSIAALRATQDVSWAEAGFQVLGFAVFAALAYLLARRLRLRTTVAPAS